MVLIFGQPHEVVHGKTVVFRQLCKVERAYIRAFVGFIFSQRGSRYARCLFQFRKGHAAAGSLVFQFLLKRQFYIHCAPPLKTGFVTIIAQGISESVEILRFWEIFQPFGHTGEAGLF